MTIRSSAARSGAGLLLLCTIATGCATTAPARQPPQGDVAVPAIGAEARGLVLPFDAYELSDRDIHTIESAEDLLLRRCMRDRGMSWKLLPRAAGKDLAPPNRTRYGPVEAEVARRFGYHAPPPLPTAARREATGTSRDADLTSRQRRAAYGRDGTGGCWRAAHARLLRGTPTSDHSLFNRLVTRDFERSRRDAAVRRGVRAWSACLRAKGFRHADPLSVADKPVWARSSRPSPEEVRTAVADVRCKARTRLAEIWRAAEARLQTETIRAHARSFRALKAAKQHWLRAADRVLARRDADGRGSGP